MQNFAAQPLTLFYYPRACSLAVHIILEETGVQFDRVLVDIQDNSGGRADYMRVNPTGAVPALSIGGQDAHNTLTETHAILTFLGDLKPELGLLPATGMPQRYRAHQLMNFLSSSMHINIRSQFRPAAFVGDDSAAEAAVRQQGLVNLAKTVKALEAHLYQGPFALGEHFSVVDAYLFVMYLWTFDERVGSIPDRPRWEAIAVRVWQRPATRRAVAFEQQFRNYRIPAILG